MKLFKIFGIDTNDFKFKNTVATANASAITNFYKDSHYLRLYISFDIAPGDKFDVTRLSEPNFEYRYKFTEGYKYD